MKTDKPWFVMLIHPTLGYVPLDCGKDEFELARFATEKEAHKSAYDTTLGEKFGYRVYHV